MVKKAEKRAIGEFVLTNDPIADLSKLLDSDISEALEGDGEEPIATWEDIEEVLKAVECFLQAKRKVKH